MSLALVPLAHTPGWYWSNDENTTLIPVPTSSLSVSHSRGGDESNLRSAYNEERYWLCHGAGEIRPYILSSDYEQINKLTGIGI